MQKHEINDHDCLDTSIVLDLALEYLEFNYIEVRKDVFLNYETGAVVRMIDYDLSGHNGKHAPHVNFETIKAPKGVKYHVSYRD